MSNEDFSLLDWMETGTVAERKVTHYNDQAAYSDYLDWERRYEEAEAQHGGDGGEEVLGCKDVFDELDAEGEQVLERLQASKSVWSVRALTSEDHEVIEAERPLEKVQVHTD